MIGLVIVLAAICGSAILIWRLSVRRDRIPVEDEFWAYTDRWAEDFVRTLYMRVRRSKRQAELRRLVERADYHRRLG